MIHFTVIYSKYFITLFLFLFLACGFWGLCYESVSDQKAAAGVQSLFLYLTQFAAYLTIVIRTQRTEYLILYAFLLILTAAAPVFSVMLYPGTNRILLNHVLMMLTAGMIVLTRLELSRAVRQLVIAAISFVLALFLPRIMKKWKWLRDLGWAYAVIGLLAIAAVLVLGQVTHGSKLSWTVAGITFQPSEFVKLLYIFFIASLLAQDTGFLQVFLCGVGAAAHVGILVLSRDLGSALIFFVVYVLMVTAATHRLFYSLLGAAAGAGASAAAWRLFDHVQVRVQAWRDPWSVIDGQGYQITQSLFAMSRGGMFGLGIGKGTPDDIPYVETDFVFSALVEELGMLFGIGIVLTGIVIFLLLIRLACGLKDGFYRNLAVGTAGLLIFQIFLTIGGGTKFIPSTGVTLPFISYGGSSLMATVLLIFVMEGIYEIRYEEERKVERQRKKQAGRGEA